MKSKTILAAGIVRDIEFNSASSADLYLNKLRYNLVAYKILDSLNRSDGTVILRILTSYNNNDLIEL